MIDPKVVEALVVARSRAKRSPLNELTARELEVLAEIAQGKSNTAIAESLFLTKRAVEKHINAIFWKLGLADAADVSKRVQGRADVPGRGGREPRQLSRGAVGRRRRTTVRASRSCSPRRRSSTRISRKPGEQRDRGQHHARQPHDRRRAARTGPPPLAHTTRTPMTRAPGVCPVVDQNIAK